MPSERREHLVIGISSSALFDMEEENRIYQEKGQMEYQAYQVEHERDILKPGIGFRLVKALLNINTLLKGERRTEVIVMSRNIANTSLRIFNSLQYYGLEISRAALVGGASLRPYLYAFNTDLFLSSNERDVREAVCANIAAGLIRFPAGGADEEINQIRLGFDISSIKYSSEAELIYQNYGMAAFLEYEKINIQKNVPEGPFAKMFKTVALLQKEFSSESVPVRTALISSFNSPELQRVIFSLRAWEVRLDEAFYIEDSEKDEILKAFGADVSFSG